MAKAFAILEASHPFLVPLPSSFNLRWPICAKGFANFARNAPLRAECTAVVGKKPFAEMHYKTRSEL